MAFCQFRKEFFIVKKNVMMRAASALLVAVLLTTSAISGTFAKYTTSTTGSDSARVAYWGFGEAATITIDLFDGAYDNTVEGTDGANVIAPGTSKETQFAFGSIYTKNDAKNITAPEVDYNFTVEPKITGTHTDLDANPNFVWTLKTSSGGTVQEFSKAEDLVNAIKAAVGTNGTIRCEAGTLPENFTDDTQAYTVGWKWKFETEDDADQDATDTAMGNADNLDNVKFEITITATQID